MVVCLLSFFLSLSSRLWTIINAMIAILSKTEKNTLTYTCPANTYGCTYAHLYVYKKRGEEREEHISIAVSLSLFLFFLHLFLFSSFTIFAFSSSFTRCKRRILTCFYRTYTTQGRSTLWTHHSDTPPLHTPVRNARSPCLLLVPCIIIISNSPHLGLPVHKVYVHHSDTYIHTWPCLYGVSVHTYVSTYTYT